MQSNQPSIKIYNAVYSSVQVYECMIRGIAVMRRRADSYVNATQILKVAGVDKGRRTKILEKEILPGKHEIVQGGYGKYQGTWIPLERGRDIALQYGVAPLLAPLFDFTPTTHSLAALPVSAPTISASPRPLSASATFPMIGSSGTPGNYSSGLAPPPIMPGSALRLLHQGRAQGLFTPSTSSIAAIGKQGVVSPTGSLSWDALSPASQTPPPPQSLKRNRSETDVDTTVIVHDVPMADATRPASAGLPTNGTATVSEDAPSPAKRPRKDPTPPVIQHPSANSRSPSSSAPTNLQVSKPANTDRPVPRMANKPSIPRNLDPTIPLKDTRRAAVIAAICQSDDPTPVLNLLREIASLPNQTHNPAGSTQSTYDIDTILDDQGHTALHLASSLSRLNTVQILIANGADVHRGNHLGETPLMRTVLSTHSFEAQSLQALLSSGLSQSIMTLDTSKKSVLHHIVLVAGVKGRSVIARYYLDQIFYCITKEAGGDFGRIVDLQDEHGDTALNIAARVGSRTLVRTLVDVGANKLLMNKLGLKPGDFGVESEELSGGPKPEDVVAMLRSVPTAPVQKSQDVIADMTTMIQGLSTDFQAEIKSKQDALDVTQAHLRAATRELSEQRKQIQAWQSRCAELDMLHQRLKNIQKAIEDEDLFDWTGRWKQDGDDDESVTAEQVQPKEPEAQPTPTRLDEEDADASADDDDEATATMKPIDPVLPVAIVPAKSESLMQSPAFRYRGPSSTIIGMSTTASPFSYEPEPPIPGGNDIPTLVRLRRMKMWHMRMEELMAERMKGLRGASAEKEYMCRKIISLCTGISIDKVEEMLENLVVAVESETSVVDISRVSGFMQKVRDGII